LPLSRLVLPDNNESVRSRLFPEWDRRAETVAATAEPSNEVSRFDAEMGSEIARFSAVLLRSESAASSQIENLTVSARAISEAELGGRTWANAAQVVGNVAAMLAALNLSNDVTAQAILDMHAALLHNGVTADGDRWRTEQVWIGGSNIGPHGAVFVPPHHDRVPGAIDDLVKLIDRDDLPVLAHAAIAYTQFETIHRFPDGNGRTGRALVRAMLRAKRLTRNVTVPTRRVARARESPPGRGCLTGGRLAVAPPRDQRWAGQRGSWHGTAKCVPSSRAPGRRRRSPDLIDRRPRSHLAFRGGAHSG
jgi:Fic family protein